MQAPIESGPTRMIHKYPTWSYFNAVIIISTFTLSTSLFAEAINEKINLEDDNVTHITFKRIAPNNIVIKENTLTIRVNNSASFLLVPFDNVKKVNKVSFQWKKQGMINIKDAQHEETRQGDDAYLRVGLILKGEAELMNPLAPKWVKKVNETLRHPSGEMIYLTPGSHHQNGRHWKSPYSDKVKIIALASKNSPDGWHLSEYTFESPQSVVGLWIMADGDNTQSSFTSMLKALTLH